jgi:hypothetical protein
MSDERGTGCSRRGLLLGRAGPRSQAAGLKPALHEAEIERVIGSEAEAAGAAIASIVFERYLKLGLLARIRTKGGAKRSRARLNANLSDLRFWKNTR